MTSPSVLELVTRMNIGGPARHVLHLARELPPRFDVRVAAGRSGSEEGTLTDENVAVTPVSLIRDISPKHDLRAVGEVRRLLAGMSLLHTHMAKAGSVGRLAASTVTPRPRTVHTFHGHVLEGYFRPTVERAFLTAERRLARRTDALVAVSAEVRDALYDLGIGRANQWHVIRPASDLDPFFAAQRGTNRRVRERLGVPADAMLFAILGRLAPIKDHAAAIRAVADTGAHLAICGEGELEPQLRGLVSDLRIEDRVHFLGWVEDVPGFLAGVDGVLLTSRNEGTPLALVEAQAAGLPVVATAVGGVGDVIEHGVTGLLVPPGDPAATSQALGRLVVDPEVRQSYGDAGRRRMLRRYDPRSAVEKLARLYEHLLHAAAPV